MVLNHDVSVLLSQWALSWLVMTTEAAPLASLTSASDLCADFLLARRVNTSLGGPVEEPVGWSRPQRRINGPVSELLHLSAEGMTQLKAELKWMKSMRTWEPFRSRWGQGRVEGQSFCVDHQWRAALKKREL